MKKYLVIGNPISHSLSPRLHNYWLKQNNIDAIYDKIKLEEDGIKEIIQESSKILKRRGVLIIEHGYNQEDQVKNLLKDNYFLDIFNIKDYQGLPRITYGILDK